MIRILFKMFHRDEVNNLKNLLQKIAQYNGRNLMKPTKIKVCDKSLKIPTDLGIGQFT